MKAFIDRFSSSVKGVLSGFDRIVFKGWILPLMSASQVTSFLRSKGVLNKDYKDWMIAQTKDIVNTADQYAHDNCGQPITPISTWRIRKEELAHERQQQKQVESGLIGVWSCRENASSYRAVYCSQAGFPQIRNYPTQCKHLYFYFDDSEFGFMNIRLQTWFPYNIQICLNGREWLRRGLEKEGVDFHVHGNKFLHIADYQKAQQLLDEQLNTRFTDMLDGFTKRVFPGMEDILDRIFPIIGPYGRANGPRILFSIIPIP
ncbi:MAG: hypothetical protein V8K32_06925 [Candidatus Electrothrix gigas]